MVIRGDMGENGLFLGDDWDTWTIPVALRDRTRGRSATKGREDSLYREPLEEKKLVSGGKQLGEHFPRLASGRNAPFGTSSMGLKDFWEIESAHCHP